MMVISMQPSTPGLHGISFFSSTPSPFLTMTSRNATAFWHLRTCPQHAKK
jgi:hypothetical protein